MRIKKQPKRSVVKLGRPPAEQNGEPNTQQKNIRFLLCLAPGQMRRIARVILWNKQYLKIKCSKAFIVRTAIDEFLEREIRKQSKVSKGRFHAKIRKPQ